MSQNHRSTSSKNSSSRSRKESESHTRSKNKHESKHRTIRSDTPPLPSRRTSIEDLLKKRESLRKELKVITKCSDSDTTKKHISSSLEKSQKSSKSNSSQDQLRKRRSEDHSKIDHEKKNKLAASPLPGHYSDNSQTDSEDEEEIIERRRQQRKKLLDKINAAKDKKMDASKDIKEEKLPEVIEIEEHNRHDTSIETQKGTTDMFSEKDDFLPKDKPENVIQDNIETNAQLNDNWDDLEGYYNIRVGDEIFNNRYVIKSILGQGVFANVVKAQDKIHGKDVAVKIVRNNDLMYKTGLKELAFLKKISAADPENKSHCVMYLGHFKHKKHLCLVLESLNMDLRAVLKKYGRHQGINMKALTSYSRQLLVALKFLKKIGVIHADIKPDNILVNEKKNILKLCDFGSATTVDDNEPTPYLVSRFYRAPEIILGIPFKHSVDIWSVACTMFELATGRILFTGTSNNKMLKCFMDLKGRFPSKLIRKGKFKDQHFNYNNNFLLHKKDEFSGRENLVEMPNITITRDLKKELRKSCTNLNEYEEEKILQLKDILDKMLMLDMNQRLAISDCLKHPFIQEIPQ